jgi:dolichyl-phosphate-mannose-protein mannosyltransferase
VEGLPEIPQTRTAQPTQEQEQEPLPLLPRPPQEHERARHGPAGARMWWAPLAPIVLALTLQWLLIARRSFDGLYGQDAFAYYDYAHELARSVRHLAAPGPFAFPIGYPALVAILSGLREAPPRIAQTVSSLAAAGVVALTFLLARDLLAEDLGPRRGSTARWTAVVAAFIVGASGQLWQWGTTIMADTAALFWATLAAWALVRYVRGQRLRWLSLASAGLALAFMTRWVYAVLALPFGLFCWWCTGRGRSPVRRTLPHVLVAGAVGLAVLSPQIFLSERNPDPLVRHEWLASWSPRNAIRRDFTTPDGIARYPLPVAAFYAKGAGSPRSFFPLLTPFLLLGLALIIKERRYQLLILLGGWSAAIYGFLIGIPYQNFRFILALLPPIAILAGFGLRRSWEWLSPRWRPLLLAALVAALAGGIWYSKGVLDEFVTRKDQDLAVARWVQAAVPPHSQILSFGITETLVHYTRLDVSDTFLLSPSDLDRLVSSGRPSYLLVPLDSIETQWVGRAPDVSYRRLRDQRGLESLGTQEGYTLFRVLGLGPRN